MIQDSISEGAKTYWRKRRTVPGHMYDIDFMIFDRLLSEQDGRVSGHLLEVGAYLGKSAIVMGIHRQPSEDFVVCDVFDDPVKDRSNERENASSYSGLTRAAFEANYARFLSRPASVVQELSEAIGQYVDESSVRFAHIDGGHLYETVRTDLENALTYLRPDGLLAVDDVRSQHTPGVAAATWEFVAEERLFPICASEIKLYLSPSPQVADRAVANLSAWFSEHPEVHHGNQMLRGRAVVIVRNPRIMSPRGRMKSLIPPAVMERLMPSAQPHLGD